MAGEMEKKYWHVCTEGLEKETVFGSREDFIYGMNGVPVYAIMYDVMVLAFCLMINHVHFIVAGKEKECRDFIQSYKRRMSLLANMSGTDVCIKEIDNRDYLLKAIAYVLRNPMTAGQKVLPFMYEWGSGGIYFRGEVMPYGHLTAVRDVKHRDMRRFIRSNVILPGDYLVTDEGMVYPGSYVRSDIVERLYGTPANMLYHVLRNDCVDVELAGNVLSKVRYGDSELAGPVRRFCSMRFGCQSVSDLSPEDRCRLAEMLRKSYGIGFRQMARLTGLDTGLLRRLFGKEPD